MLYVYVLSFDLVCLESRSGVACPLVDGTIWRGYPETPHRLLKLPHHWEAEHWEDEQIQDESTEGQDLYDQKLCQFPGKTLLGWNKTFKSLTASWLHRHRVRSL